MNLLNHLKKLLTIKNKINMKMNPIIQKILVNGKEFGGGIVLKQPMIDNFVGLVKRDRKKFENINIYYEIMNPENCKKLGYPYDMKTLNCIDGDSAWNCEKLKRESKGFFFIDAEDFIIGGVRCKRIIMSDITKRGQDFGDKFGMMSDYFQAGHEVIAYMVSYGKYLK